MPVTLRIALITFAFLTGIYVIQKIKKAQMKIDDSLFWIMLSGLIIILSVFPDILSIPVQILKIESPANLIYLIFVFILILKLFTMSIKISQLENKITQITQTYAIDRLKDIDYEEKSDIM